MKNHRLLLIVLLVVIAFVGCTSVPEDQIGVPEGDPPFPVFTGEYIIDWTRQIPRETLVEANAILQQLRDEGIAEVFILVTNDITHPEQYATRMGRALELGDEETDNGLVYLLRPDAPTDQHIIYSVGRGLTGYTQIQVTEASAEASTLANQQEVGAALLSLVQGTDEQLRKLHAQGSLNQKEASDEEGSIIGAIIIAVAFIAICVGLSIIDPDLGYICFRIFIMALASSGSKTGGSGKFGGRSGNR